VADVPDGGGALRAGLLPFVAVLVARLLDEERMLALALVFASFTPLWALVLWMAKSSAPPWRWVSRWLRGPQLVSESRTRTIGP